MIREPPTRHSAILCLNRGVRSAHIITDLCSTHTFENNLPGNFNILTCIFQLN